MLGEADTLVETWQARALAAAGSEACSFLFLGQKVDPNSSRHGHRAQTLGMLSPLNLVLTSEGVVESVR